MRKDAQLVAGGAQALVPLAARLIPYAVSPEEVEREIGVPVINTQAVGIRFAELMVNSQNAAQPEGLSVGSRPERGCGVEAGKSPAGNPALRRLAPRTPYKTVC